MRKALFVLLLISIILSLFIACDGEKSVSRTGTIEISISSQNSSRGIEPTSMEVSRYSISVTDSGSAVVFSKTIKTDDGSRSCRLQLPVGSYTVEVSAYNKEGKKIGEGDADVDVVVDQTTQCSVVIHEMQGKGTISFSFSGLEGDALVAKIYDASMFQIESLSLVFAGGMFTGSIELDNGFYMFKVVRTDGTVRKTDTIRIIAGTTLSIEDDRPIEIDASSFSSNSGWMFVSSGSSFYISNIEDNEFLVLRTDDSCRTEESVSKRNLVSNGLGGFIILPDDNGSCRFSLEDIGFTGSSISICLVKMPVVEVDSSNCSSMRSIKVVDANSKDNGKYYIPDSKCDYYYVDEKILNIDLSDIRLNYPSVDLSRCVISRISQYYDHNLAEDQGDVGIHNTRETYGILFADQNGNIRIVNNGIIDLTGLDSIRIYEGFASNIIAGSGISIVVLPVTEVTEEEAISVSEEDSIFLIKDVPRGKYALEISDFGNLEPDNFLLNTTAAEIRTVSGNSCQSGFTLNYMSGEDSFLYYLGEVTESIYVDNHMRNLMDNQEFDFKVRLVRLSDDVISTLTTPWQRRLILEGAIGSVGGDSLTTEDGTITYRRVFTDDSSLKYGQLSCVLTGFESRSVSFKVNFQHWDYDANQWVDSNLNEATLSYVINYISSNGPGEKTVSTSKGTLVVRLQYRNTHNLERAVILFEEQ